MRRIPTYSDMAGDPKFLKLVKQAKKDRVAFEDFAAVMREKGVAEIDICLVGATFFARNKS
jgi:hypothetical protein